VQAVFSGGVPARITKTDVRRAFLASFPKLTDVAYDELIDDAISAVYAMFSGVARLWDWHDRDTWFEKTTLCYRLLTAWYIADMYPTLLSGIPVMGPIPLKRKKIGPIDVTYRDDAAALRANRDYQDLLSSLRSNPFGGKAYLMIRAAAKRAALSNRRIV
jgi:hypothetical protein